jgi:hypothetical protein
VPSHESQDSLSSGHSPMDAISNVVSMLTSMFTLKENSDTLPDHPPLTVPVDDTLPDHPPLTVPVDDTLPDHPPLIVPVDDTLPDHPPLIVPVDDEPSLSSSGKGRGVSAASSSTRRTATKKSSGGFKFLQFFDFLESLVCHPIATDVRSARCTSTTLTKSENATRKVVLSTPVYPSNRGH